MSVYKWERLLESSASFWLICTVFAPLFSVSIVSTLHNANTQSLPPGNDAVTQPKLLSDQPGSISLRTLICIGSLYVKHYNEQRSAMLTWPLRTQSTMEGPVVMKADKRMIFLWININGRRTYIHTYKNLDCTSRFINLASLN